MFSGLLLVCPTTRLLWPQSLLLVFSGLLLVCPTTHSLSFFPCLCTDKQKCNHAKYAPLLAHIRVQSGEASEEQDYARVNQRKSTFSADFKSMSHP